MAKFGISSNQTSVGDGQGQSEYVRYLKELARRQKEQEVAAAQKQLDAANAANDERLTSTTDALHQSYDQQTADAAEAYRQAAERQAQVRDEAQRISGVQAARIEKFLPQMLASQGLSGGLAQSLTVDAYNAAARRSSDASRSYADAIAGLDAERMAGDSERSAALNRGILDARNASTDAAAQARSTYADAVARANSQQLTAEANAYDADYQRAYQERLQRAALQEQQRIADGQTYMDAFDNMMASQITAMAGEAGAVDAEDFDAWVKSTKTGSGYAGLSEQQKAIVDAKIEAYRAEVTGAGAWYDSKIGSVTGSYTSGDHNKYLAEGDNFTVTVGGTDYKIRSSGEVTEDRVIQAAKGLEDDTVFLFNDTAYVKRDSLVFGIEQQKDYNKNGYERKQYIKMMDALRGETQKKGD